MSSLIFGRGCFQTELDLNLLNSDSICVYDLRTAPTIFRSGQLEERMLSHSPSPSCSKSLKAFTLVSEMHDSTADELIKETHFMNPDATDGDLREFVRKLDAFAWDCFREGADSLEVVTSTGYSDKSDFEFVNTPLSKFADKLYIRLVCSVVELPSLWFRIEALNEVR